MIPPMCSKHQAAQYEKFSGDGRHRVAFCVECEADRRLAEAAKPVQICGVMTTHICGRTAPCPEHPAGNAQWVGTAASQCDCWSKTPSYPTFRSNPHVPGCRFYVEGRLFDPGVYR